MFCLVQLAPMGPAVTMEPASSLEVGGKGSSDCLWMEWRGGCGAGQPGIAENATVGQVLVFYSAAHSQLHPERWSMPDKARNGIHIHTGQLTKSLSLGQGSYFLGFGAGLRAVTLQLDVHLPVSEHLSLELRSAHAQTHREDW